MTDSMKSASTTAFALEDVGTRLATHLGLTDGYKGNVGIGSNQLFVYIRKAWRGEKLANFEGVPVVWRENTGTARALAG